MHTTVNEINKVTFDKKLIDHMTKLSSGDSKSTIDPFSEDSIFNDRLELIQYIKEGMHHTTFTKLYEIMELGNEELAGLLRISTKTL